LFTDIKKYVEICGSNNISPAQFLLLWLLHTKDVDTLRRYVELTQGWPQSDVTSLEDRGYILNFNSNRGESSKDNYFHVTERFTDLLYTGDNATLIDEDVAFDELFNAYPTYIIINGRKVSARSCNLFEMRKRYGEAIKGSNNVHKDILLCLEYAKTRDLLNMGLEKFIMSEQWRTIAEDMDTGSDSTGFQQDI
jgi:hypothetical protein